MTRRTTVRHEFVDHFPEVPEEGVIYVSVPFATATHRCCCGCGQEVITPLSPTDWRLTFDGESVSLAPSIGNWSFPCQSHYWIRRNRVEWARRFTAQQVRTVREADRVAKSHYYVADEHSRPSGTPTAGTIGHRVRRWLSRNKGGGL